MIAEIIRKIEEYDRIIIHRHTNPDGDALGSQIGLKHLIRATYPDKTVYTVGDMSKRYAFMAKEPMDEIPEEYYEGALAIILDTSASHLISDTRYTAAASTVRIDHHIFCEKIADIELVDTSYESCCGLVTELSRKGGLKMTAPAATALFTGMVTDSGRFRYDSTNANTFSLASYLMEYGVDTGEIYRNLYADDFSFIRLRAQFVLKVAFTEANVAYIYTTLEEAKGFGVDTFTISRGMVGVMSDVRGVDVWVNFTETEDGVLCELRSSKYNVNPVAVKYGGGGHAKASGATVPDRAMAMKLLADLDALAGGKNE